MMGWVKHLTDDQKDALATGTMPGVEQARCQEHLTACVRCRREVEALRLVDAGLRDLPLEEVRPEFPSAVMAEIERLVPGRGLSSMGGVFAGLVAAFLVVGTLLIVFASSGVLSMPDAASGGERGTSFWSAAPVDLASFGTKLLQSTGVRSNGALLPVATLTLLVLAAVGGADLLWGRREFRGGRQG